MCNSQLFLTHVLFTTKYLQLIFHSTKTQQEASIAIQILWRKKTRATKCSEQSDCQLIFFCVSELSGFDNSFLRLRTKKKIFLKCQRIWSLDPPSDWKSAKQMMENNCRWKEDVCQFFGAYFLWRYQSHLNQGSQKWCRKQEKRYA